MQHSIREGIIRDGGDAFPGLNMVEEEQRFGWGLDYGFHFEMHSIRESGRFFTWEEVWDVVEGLRLYLVVGERCFATVFNFWDGGRWWWRVPLGGGGFVVDGEGKGEVVEQMS